MKLSSLGKGVLKGLTFVYQHPEALEVIAATTGHAEIASGIATVVGARQAAQAAAAGAAPPTTAPVPPPVVVAVAAVTPDAPPVLVPEVDLVGKWRGTLDRMAMEVLGYRMAEDELFNNAKLLEAGDVAGVMKNLEEKKKRP